MSGMCRAHARQNSKFKAKFQSLANSKSWDVRKKKAIAKHEHFVRLKQEHPPKVPRGTARKMRRAAMLHKAVA